MRSRQADQVSTIIEKSFTHGDPVKNLDYSETCLGLTLVYKPFFDFDFDLIDFY